MLLEATSILSLSLLSTSYPHQHSLIVHVPKVQQHMMHSAWWCSLSCFDWSAGTDGPG